MGSSRAASRAKGNARESEVQAYLESLGYFVDRAVQTGFRLPCKPCPRCSFKGSRWLARSNDRWGVFDLLAEAADQPKLLAVQVTYDTNASGRRKKILEVAHRFNLDRTDVLVYIWHPKKRQDWTAERLIKLPTVPELFTGPRGIEDDASEFQSIKWTYRFEKLGYIDIPKKVRETAARKETVQHGEGPDVLEGEEHEQGDEEEEEAEADEITGPDL